MNTNLPQNLPIKNVVSSEDKKNQGIPRQYSNPAARIANKAGKEDVVERSEDVGDTTPNEDPDEMNEYDVWTKLMNTVNDMTVEGLYDNFGDRIARMAITESEIDVDVRAHTEFYKVIDQLVKGSNLNVYTSDNGADTCVVGIGWKVVTMTARKANLLVLIQTVQERKDYKL
jgi:hypothetical protein